MTTKNSLKPNETPKTENAKTEFSLKEFFALWKHETKRDLKKPNEPRKPYYTGHITSDEYKFSKLLGFQNSEKKNPDEPDLRIYLVDKNNEMDKEEFISLWHKVTEDGKEYFSGKFNEEFVVGFISENTENNRPSIRVYFSDDKVDK